jgi:hypothetical protein
MEGLSVGPVEKPATFSEIALRAKTTKDGIQMELETNKITKQEVTGGGK